MRWFYENIKYEMVAIERFKGCSSLQLLYNLTGMMPAIGYYYYTSLYAKRRRPFIGQLLRKPKVVFADTKANAEKPKELFLGFATSKNILLSNT